MDNGDYLKAESDLWKVASLIVTCTGLQDSIDRDKNERGDKDDIQKWANGTKRVNLDKKAESLSGSLSNL